MRKWLTRCAVAAVVFLILLRMVMHQLHAPPISTGKPLPPGKVEPQMLNAWGTAALVAPDGSLWAWGFKPDWSRVSVLPRLNSDVPCRVGTNSDWMRVALGMMQHIVALKSDGSLWAWGWNTEGQVGQGNFTNSYATPTRIGTETRWTQICAGMAHNLALKNDGSLWAWGCNSCGQLGDGTTVNRSVPTRLGNDRDWRTIVAESYSSIALKSNGTIWGWGLLGYGNGSSNVLTPRRIDSGTNWLAISAHDYNLAALKTDGTLWLNAQALVSTLTENFTQIGQDRDWVAVYAGPISVFARKNDRSWWACGKNDTGQLGLGTNMTTAASPQRLPFGFDPWAFAAGDGSTLMLGKDGKLWAWGKRLGAPNSGQRKLKTFLSRIVKRFPSLGFLIKSDIDQAPHLLWELPPEVRR